MAKTAALVAIDQFGDQPGSRGEKHPLFLKTGRIAKGSRKVGLASAGFSNNDYILPTLNVFALEQRPNQAFVNGRLGGKVEVLDCLDDRKTCPADLALAGAAPQVLANDDA